MSHLTSGFIGAVSWGDIQHPYLQIVSIKALSNPNVASSQSTTTRYRLALSDGTHTMMAMLATQLNPLITDGALAEHSIVQLDDFVVNQVHDKRILIILALTTICNPGLAIGQPTPVPETNPCSFDPSTSKPQLTTPPLSSSAPRQTSILAFLQPPPQPQQPLSFPNLQQLLNSPSAPSALGGGLGFGSSTLPSAPSSSASSTSFSLHPSSATAPMPSPSSRLSLPSAPHSPLSPPAPQWGLTPIHSSSSSSSSAPPPGVEQPKAGEEQAIVPIASLNPYLSKWRIKARVATKLPIRQWSSAKGPGKLFSITLVDASGSEISAIFFNNAVDVFEPVIQQGQVYIMGGGQLKCANRRFSRVDNDWEIVFDASSSIEPVAEGSSIPSLAWHCEPIASLITNRSPDDIVDVMAVVLDNGDIVRVMSKRGNELVKRDILLIDESNASIQLTVWGDERCGELTEVKNGTVIGVTAVRISSFGGVSLSSTFSTRISVQPDHPRRNLLEDWWRTAGSQCRTFTRSTHNTRPYAAPISRSPTLTIAEVQNLEGDSTKYFELKATVVFIRHDSDLWYNACPACNKKMVIEPDGKYQCYSCNQTTNPVKRYILSIVLEDHTGKMWASCFNETAETLLGISANELAAIREQTPSAFEKVVSKACFRRFSFKLARRLEYFAGAERARITVHNIQRLDVEAESTQLSQRITKALRITM